jgi:hypothetical protein
MLITKTQCFRGRFYLLRASHRLLAIVLAIATSTLSLRLATVRATSRAYLLSRELGYHTSLLNTRLEFSTVIVSSEETVLRKVRSTWSRTWTGVAMTPVSDDETGLFIVRQ